MPKWTKEQQQAIDARNHTLLVSAAAGSGKTAVLVERIVSLVREGYHLNRMMIVTFTRAAAGEMRQRLNIRLTKEAAADPAIFGAALDELEGTDISTIHSFCQRVIRSEFQAVGVDPMARVCDEQLRQKLFEEAYREAANHLLDTEPAGSDFLQLASAFHQSELMDMTSSLYTFLMSMPDPFGWLRAQTEQIAVSPLSAHPWYQTLLRKARLELTGLDQYLYVMGRMFDEPDAVPQLRVTWEKDRQLIDQLADACASDPDALPGLLANVSFATAARATRLTPEQDEWKERFNKLRKEMKETLKNSAEALQLEPEQSLHDLTQVAAFVRGLALLTETVHTRFMALKNHQNVMDFSDMEQMTLQILSQEEHREALQQDYDHIFVDECQDVSAVQDAIVQLIHGPDSCLFMVGDVKQSIYRFRLADPTLFLHRMRTFSDEPDAEERRIFLQKNFRSRPAVLDASNRVFRSAMRASVTELDYLPEDELIPGRETINDPPVEIRLVDRNERTGNAEDALRAETAVVVRRIGELLNTTFDDNGQERPYQYRDMVILLAKTSGVGARLAELLEEQGVPVYFDGKDDYYGLPEVRTVRELLRVIDNPLQDIPLLTVLKMIPFSMSDSELAQIRMCRTGKQVHFYEAFAAACEEETPLGERCRTIRSQLNEWRFRKECMRLSDFVWHVIRESGYYAACGAYPEGTLRQANLRLLSQRAAEYEQQYDGVLSGFLSMIDMQISASDSKSAKVLGENENLVRIMTMHKSKGLEFPVVFCMRLTADMMGRAPGTLKMHSKLGVCLPYVNSDLHIKRDTLGSEAFKYQRRLDELAARCRLLYVAMTRARERLILTGCADQTECFTWNIPNSDYSIWHADCMMDWIMQVVMSDFDLTLMPDETITGGPWQLTLEPDVPLADVTRTRNTDQTMDWIRNIVSIPTKKGLFDAWNDQRLAASARPIKTSVTSLARQETLHDPMPLSDEDESMDEKRHSEEIVAPLRMSELPSRPAFMEEKHLTGADRGTMMHKMLSLIPLDSIRGMKGRDLMDKLYQEASDLVMNGCFDQTEVNMLNFYAISSYFAGPLGQRMLASSEVHREWGFNLRINRTAGTLLQGIIDCAFIENDQWILLDYKTDRIDSEEAFVQRHALQLNWYAEALERITGKPVAELWLYSLGREKAYEVPRESISILQ